MKRPLLTLLATAMLFSPLAAVTAQADDVRSRMIRFGYGLNESSNQGRAAKLFAEEVAKASEGKLKMRTFAAASLGSDDQMQSALMGGAQEMMVGSTATLVGITKEMAVWDTPFLFSNEQQADAVLDGPVGREHRGLGSEVLGAVGRLAAVQPVVVAPGRVHRGRADRRRGARPPAAAGLMRRWRLFP